DVNDLGQPRDRAVDAERRDRGPRHRMLRILGEARDAFLVNQLPYRWILGEHVPSPSGGTRLTNESFGEKTTAGRPHFRALSPPSHSGPRGRRVGICGTRHNLTEGPVTDP